MSEKQAACGKLQWWAFGTTAVVSIAIIIASSVVANKNQYKNGPTGLGPGTTDGSTIDVTTLDSPAASPVWSPSLWTPTMADGADGPTGPTGASSPAASSPSMTVDDLASSPTVDDEGGGSSPVTTTTTPTRTPSLRPTTASSTSTTTAPTVVEVTATNETESTSEPTTAPSSEVADKNVTMTTSEPTSEPSTVEVDDDTNVTTTTSEPTAAPSTAVVDDTLAPTAVETDPLDEDDSSSSSMVSQMVPTTGSLTKRHEACFVAANTNENSKAYLIGGRGVKPVNELDPRTGIWTAKSNTPIELHHMQCVAVDNEIYILNAWTGDFPYEQNVEQVMVYDTLTDTWSNRVGLPEPRQRGGGSSVLVTNPTDGTREIYVSHGNRGGHGVHSESLPWFDKYNVDLDEWTTNLPDAPNARDHTGGALMADGNTICVAGGRNSGIEGYLNKPVLPTDCYNLDTGEWEEKEDIPQGRAGSSYGTTCDGNLVVAGGEGFGQAWDNVDMFDGIAWTSLDDLVQARHGSGLATFCGCGEMLIASGSGNQGGGPELETTERIITPSWDCGDAV